MDNDVDFYGGMFFLNFAWFIMSLGDSSKMLFSAFIFAYILIVLAFDVFPSEKEEEDG